ncbi:MAG: hypothetical protein HQL37_01935 [Alphaproteobacteria bacterium]|nr:hypothetical protein [Alphaproteobacteria bacterium]
MPQRYNTSRRWTLFRCFIDRLRDCRGNIAIITALALPALIGVAGLGVETSYWYYLKRGMQNAADAAVVAAATNNSSGYASEALAVAAQYGFQNGVNQVTITAASSLSCPSGISTSPCYSVTITILVPQFLSQVVGYTAATTISNVPYTRISSTGMAVSTSHSYCLLALGNSGAVGIQGNGAPFANLAGCSIMSDTSATCSGHNLNADYGDAHTINNNCGVVANSNYPKVSDPYAYLTANIPANSCGGNYPQKPAKKHDPSLPVSNQWSGATNLSGNVMVCGDLQLTGNVTINAPSGAVLVIENGQLDTNGYTLQTSSGSVLTVVFSGTNGSYTHVPTGGGTLNFSAPTSGVWSGVAIYQDPALTTGVNVTAAGNSPTWDITGLVYLPNSSVTFSGAVNKSSNGSSCFGLVVDNIVINGTGAILAHGGCSTAGLTLPQGASRAQLVY